MKTLFYIFILFLFSPLLTLAQGFTTNTTTGDLIDANGNNFIMKGMSVPLQFFQNDVNTNIANIRKNTNANCLRIVMYTYTPDAVWQQCVQNCINNNIIPIVELQEVTGSTDPNELVRMGKYWASKAAYLTQPNIAKYVLINLCNEWGTWNEANSKGTVWRDASTDAIKLMRAAGIKTTVIVDAVGYGQDIDDAKNIRAYAKTMQASDAGFLKANANLVFSIHMYCEWKKGGDNVGIIGDIKKTGVPIMIGEFGFQHSETGGTCDIDETLIINTCETNKIGWLAWSQKGNGNGVDYLDLCSDWSCANLSGWGNTVVNGTYGTKTSITCSVYLGLTARAGDDQFIIDADKNGTETVTLDGSNSTTNKGTLTYAWKENGQTLSTAVKPTLQLSAGVHTITLTVSDGVNTPVSDNVVITIKTPSLSYLKPVVVSSVEANSLHYETDAVDGKPDTRWASVTADPQTITVDLQSIYKISSVLLSWEFASAKDYVVSISTDGITYKPIITKTGMAAGERIDNWTGLDTLARFVRVNGTARTSNYGYSLFEFEIYGTQPTITQSIQLQKGWNLISTNVKTTDSSIAKLFTGLDVQEIKTTDAFWNKGQNIALNSLKAIESGKGYLVNMNASETLTISGIPLETQNIASLQTGWQLIGCPYQNAVLLSTLFNTNNIQIIKNFEGFWTTNGTTNSITEIQPGKGYFIKK